MRKKQEVVMQRSTYAFWCCSLLLCTPPLWADFIRGDANGDGRVNIQDPIEVLTVLFSTESAFGCADAADADDDGTINVLDALKVLAFLFQGDSLLAPGPRPGPDPTCDALTCNNSRAATPAIVLSEIMYNSDRGSLFDFVELHNRTEHDINLSGYAFTQGIRWAFAADTIIPGGGFLLLAKDPDRFVRRNPAGPYEGELSNGGERLTLMNDDCVVETVRYNDRGLWPLGPDGYGPSLERIDCAAPADDVHSWRASFRQSGTPGTASSTAGTPTHPLLVSNSRSPPQASSRDSVELKATFDVTARNIAGVTLRHKTIAIGGGFDLVESQMQLVSDADDSSTFAAMIPPQPSQSMVRWNVEVELTNGERTLLPHEADARPVLSYFVYDFEIEHKLPLLWLLPARKGGLYSEGAAIAGAVVVENGSDTALVFDGARRESSENGEKLRFLKGQEYRGDRTVNLLPEASLNVVGGPRIPFVEQLGFQIFRDAGAIACRADWFRVIEYKNPLTGHIHSQRAMVQQQNERFLIDNGLSDNGDLYKLEKGAFEKHTNECAGDQSRQDLNAALTNPDDETRNQFVLDNFDLENFRLYSVVGTFLSNWDGFHNNMYFYNSLESGGRWMTFPWDLDQVLQPEHATLPVTYPADGRGETTSRPAGYLSRPYHAVPQLDQEYRETLLASIQPGGLLSSERLLETVRVVEELLLSDLALLEILAGETLPEHREHIVSAYASTRQFIAERIAFLDTALSQ
jgi:hypothetical protein